MKKLWDKSLWQCLLSSTAAQGSWKAFLYLHSPCQFIDNFTKSMLPKAFNDFVLSFKKILSLKWLIAQMRFRFNGKPSACTEKNCLHTEDMLLFHWNLCMFYFGLELNIFSVLSYPFSTFLLLNDSLLALPPAMKSRMSTCLYGYFCVIKGNLQKQDCLRWMIIYSSFSLAQIQSFWEGCSWGVTRILNT